MRKALPIVGYLASLVFELLGAWQLTALAAIAAGAAAEGKARGALLGLAATILARATAFIGIAYRGPLLAASAVFSSILGAPALTSITLSLMVAAAIGALGGALGAEVVRLLAEKLRRPQGS